MDADLENGDPKKKFNRAMNAACLGMYAEDKNAWNIKDYNCLTVSSSPMMDGSALSLGVAEIPKPEPWTCHQVYSQLVRELEQSFAPRVHIPPLVIFLTVSIDYLFT